MKPSSPLPMLIELAQKEADEAARKLSAMLALQQQSEQKFNLLLSYRNEYQQRLTTNVQQGIATATLQNFDLFLKKLSDAIEQQRNELNHWKTSVNTAQALWQQAQRKLRSFGILEQRRQHQLTHQGNRLLQKQTDEFAARATQLNRTN